MNIVYRCRTLYEKYILYIEERKKKRNPTQLQYILYPDGIYAVFDDYEMQQARVLTMDINTKIFFDIYIYLAAKEEMFL